LLPIRDDNPVHHTPWVTMAIIALNVVAFLLWEPTFATGPGAQQRQEAFFYCHAEIPWETSHQTTLADGGAAARRAMRAGDLVPAGGIQAYLRAHCPNKSWILSVFAAMFLHVSFLHIGGNMLFLWIFGNNVEDKLGRVKYLLFYFASGLAATVAQVAINVNSVEPNLGASGAIAGVLGAYLIMFPRRRVLTLIFFFIITWVYLPAVVVLGAWFGLQLLSGIGALGQRLHPSGGGAFFAHIGGFSFGALMALLFFPKEGFRTRPPPPRPDLSGRRGWKRRSQPGPAPGLGWPNSGGSGAPPGPPGLGPPRPDYGEA
jgi:membrane associated rhomboid family serine protease